MSHAQNSAPNHIDAPQSAAERELSELAPELISLRQSVSTLDSNENWAALTDALDDERGVSAWFRNRSTRARVTLALGWVLAICLYQLLFSLRADFEVYPETIMLMAIASSGLVISAAVMSKLWPLQLPQLSRRWTWLVISATLALPLLQAIGPVHLAHPASLEGSGESFVPRALACFSYGSILSAPLLLLLLVLDRREAPTTMLITLAALAAGVAANLALLLHCPITHPSHLLAGHAPIGIALAALGVLAYRFHRGRKS